VLIADKPGVGVKRGMVGSLLSFDSEGLIGGLRMDRYIRDLKFNTLPISSLAIDGRNPRTHTPKQIRQIADSIRTLGFNNPILVDDHGNVVAGHGRIKAAELLGIAEVPTIRLSRMTEAERRAYAIADNKLAENAGWDRDLLSLELRYISELEIDLDPTITGFEAAEIDVLWSRTKAVRMAKLSRFPMLTTNTGSAVPVPATCGS
jgi:ParB-like nuclease domain